MSHHGIEHRAFLVSFIALTATSACSGGTEGPMPCETHDCSPPVHDDDTGRPVGDVPKGKPTPHLRDAPSIADGGGRSSDESADPVASATKPDETAPTHAARSWLAYTTEGGEHPSGRQLFLARGRAPGPRRQLALGRATWFEWLPDGSAIAYGVKTPGTPYTSIVLSELDGKTFRAPRQIFEGNTEQCSTGTWSPDAQTLAIPCDGRIVFVPRSGQAPRSLWMTQEGLNLRWSPDSRSVWISAEPRPGELYHAVIPFDAPAAPPMQRLDFARWVTPQWAPDGSRVILNAIAQDSTYTAHSIEPEDVARVTHLTLLGQRTDVWGMGFLSDERLALLLLADAHADIFAATPTGSTMANLAHFSAPPGWRVSSVRLVGGRALVGTYASEPDASGQVDYAFDARDVGARGAPSLAAASSPRLAIAADLSGTLSIGPRSDGPVLAYGPGLSSQRRALARLEDGGEYPLFFFSEDGTRAFFSQKRASDAPARQNYVDLRGDAPRTFELDVTEGADAKSVAFSADSNALGYLVRRGDHATLRVTDVSGASPSAPVAVIDGVDTWAWQPSAE